MSKKGNKLKATNQIDFETKVVSQLDEILARLDNLEKNTEQLLTRHHLRTSRGIDTVITKLGPEDQNELCKLGLPIVSLDMLNEFEARLENAEFRDKVVGLSFNKFAI